MQFATLSKLMNYYVLCICLTTYDINRYHIYSICCYSVEYIDLAKPKRRACIFFFLHVSRLPRPGLEPRLSDPEPSALTTGWTTEQSHGIGVPAVQLTMHVKSSTLYGHTVVRSYGQIFSA